MSTRRVSRGGNVIKHRLVWLGWTQAALWTRAQKGCVQRAGGGLRTCEGPGQEGSGTSQQSPSMCQEAGILSTWSPNPKLAGVQKSEEYARCGGPEGGGELTSGFELTSQVTLGRFVSLENEMVFRVSPGLRASISGSWMETGARKNQ